MKIDTTYGFTTINPDFACNIVCTEPESSSSWEAWLEFIAENAFELMDLCEYLYEFIDSFGG